MWGLFMARYDGYMDEWGRLQQRMNAGLSEVSLVLEDLWGMVEGFFNREERQFVVEGRRVPVELGDTMAEVQNALGTMRYHVEGVNRGRIQLVRLVYFDPEYQVQEDGGGMGDGEEYREDGYQVQIRDIDRKREELRYKWEGFIESSRDVCQFFLTNFGMLRMETSEDARVLMDVLFMGDVYLGNELLDELDASWDEFVFF